MQQIINALLRNLSLVLYLVLLGFALIFLSNRSFYHQTQMYRLGMGISGWLHQGSKSLTQYFELERENEILQREVALVNQLLKGKDSFAAQTNYLGYRAIPADLIQKSYHRLKTYLLQTKDLVQEYKKRWVLLAPKV